MKIHFKLLLAALALPLSTVAHASETIESIKARGVLHCGVHTGVAGFAIANDKGEWEGIDVDVCRATAAAIFGDASKIKYTPLTSQQRFTALQSGEVDILSRTTTWTLTRDTKLGIDFQGVNFYDGQGFMAHKRLGIKSSTELDGATVCVEPGTTTELNLADYFRANKMEFKPIVIDNVSEAMAAYFAGRCDVFTTDSSLLASLRITTAEVPEDHIILPEIISKEPLGPSVRHGDQQFSDVVRWSLIAMKEAEEKGITSKNVDEMLKSEDPGIKRMLGVTPGMGEALGIDEKWMYNIIKQVGNYGESYDRNIKKTLGLERGVNDLWTRGGLMYPFPIR